MKFHMAIFVLLSVVADSFAWSARKARQLREERNADLLVDTWDAIVVNGGDRPGRARRAFRRNLSPNYREHNPGRPDGRQAFREFIVENRPPNFTYEIGAVFAEGDYVAVHGLVGGVAPVPIVGIDILRIVDGELTEHWDVGQALVPANQSANGNSMFPIPNLPIRPRGFNIEERNRLTAVEVLESLFARSDSSVLDTSFNPNYIQHNPLFPNGVEAVRGFIDSTEPGDLSIEIGLAIAYGDFVLTHARYNLPAISPNPLIIVDIFRFQNNGRIAEHWDVIQEEVSILNSVSGNNMHPIY